MELCINFIRKEEVLNIIKTWKLISNNIFKKACWVNHNGFLLFLLISLKWKGDRGKNWLLCFRIPFPFLFFSFLKGTFPLLFSWAVLAPFYLLCNPPWNIKQHYLSSSLLFSGSPSCRALLPSHSPHHSPLPPKLIPLPYFEDAICAGWMCCFADH